MEYYYDSKTGGFVLNEETTDESLTTQITAAFIASLLAVPGIVNADRISRNFTTKPTVAQFQSTVRKVAEKAPRFGGYTTLDAANILARTLYAEAAGESTEGKKMVATVIWNRAGGDTQKLIRVCFASSQFSCWNGVDRTILKPGVYKITIPSDIAIPSVKRAWDVCQALASEMLKGTFTPLGNYNAYLNPKKADPDALATWGTTMTGQKVVGKHRFGYLPEKDPNRPKRNKMFTYKVVSGDSVSKIATNLIQAGKTNITDLTTLKNQIVAVNKLKNNGDTIYVGQVLKIPQGVQENGSENRWA